MKYQSITKKAEETRNVIVTFDEKLRQLVATSSNPFGDSDELLDGSNLSAVELRAPIRSTPVKFGPTGYWRFGEPPGSTVVTDSSGNGLTGSYVGLPGPTLGVPGAFADSPDTAMQLNGTSQYVIITDNPMLHLGDVFSLEIWANVNTIQTVNPQTLFDEGHTGGNGPYFMILVGGMLEFGQRQSGTNGWLPIATSTKAIVPGVWTHLVASKNGSAGTKIYMNGEDVTGTFVDRTITDTTDTLHIGASSNPDRYFGGLLDEAAIYPVALTAQQVFSLYHAGFLTVGAPTMTGTDLMVGNRKIKASQAVEVSIGGGISREEYTVRVTAHTTGDAPQVLVEDLRVHVL